MKITIREAIRNAIDQSMENDENIFIIGEEVAEYNGAYKITQGLFDKYGAKRVIDSPITEYGFAGLATGAAFKGLKPIVEFMSMNFSMQAIDHIINSATKTYYMSGGRIKCSIIFRGPNSIARGVAAQHSQCFASWYAHCPGLIVLAPFTPQDHYILMKDALNANAPVVFLENELMYGDSSDFEFNNLTSNQIGKANVIKEGKDVTIVSFSYGVKISLEAAKELEKESISAEVIDLRTIRPLDINTIISSIKNTNRLICVEDGWGFSGIGSEIIAQINELAFDYLDAQTERVYQENIPMPYAKNLELLANISKEKIIKAVKKMI